MDMSLAKKNIIKILFKNDYVASAAKDVVNADMKVMLVWGLGRFVPQRLATSLGEDFT